MYMSLVSENLIPGNHGKVFETNAKEPAELDRIKKTILNISGIESVHINSATFPVEVTIHTSKLIAIKTVEAAVNKTGLHIVEKSTFPL